jgi:hypothetical protein
MMRVAGVEIFHGNCAPEQEYKRCYPNNKIPLSMFFKWDMRYCHNSVIRLAGSYVDVSALRYGDLPPELPVKKNNPAPFNPKQCH